MRAALHARPRVGRRRRGVTVVLMDIQHLKDAQDAIAERERQLSPHHGHDRLPRHLRRPRRDRALRQRPERGVGRPHAEEMVGRPFQRARAARDARAEPGRCSSARWPARRSPTSARPSGPGRENAPHPRPHDPGPRRLRHGARRPRRRDGHRGGPPARASPSSSARAELQLVTDNVGVPMAYIGADRRFRFANTPGVDWRPGITVENIVGKHVDEVYEPDVVAAVDAYVDRALAGEKVVYERQGMAADGRARWIRVTLIPDVVAGQVARRLLRRDRHRRRPAPSRGAGDARSASCASTPRTSPRRSPSSTPTRATSS